MRIRSCTSESLLLSRDQVDGEIDGKIGSKVKEIAYY